MKTTAELEEELKSLVVTSLMLEDVSPAEIENEEPLFGEGLGLDSIDALELGMAISKKYNIKLSQDQEKNRQYFANIQSLALYVSEQIQLQGSES